MKYKYILLNNYSVGQILGIYICVPNISYQSKSLFVTSIAKMFKIPQKPENSRCEIFIFVHKAQYKKNNFFKNLEELMITKLTLEWYKFFYDFFFFLLCVLDLHYSFHNMIWTNSKHVQQGSWWSTARNSSNSKPF